MTYHTRQIFPHSSPANNSTTGNPSRAKLAAQRPGHTASAAAATTTTAPPPSRCRHPCCLVIIILFLFLFPPFPIRLSLVYSQFRICMYTYLCYGLIKLRLSRILSRSGVVLRAVSKRYRCVAREITARCTRRVPDGVTAGNMKSFSKHCECTLLLTEFEICYHSRIYL